MKPNLKYSTPPHCPESFLHAEGKANELLQLFYYSEAKNKIKNN